MLLQLFQFFPLYPLPPGNPIPSSSHPLSSCPWVIHVSSLATPFSMLFLTSPCLFVPANLYFLTPAPPFPTFSPPLSQVVTLQMISVSMILFCLFA